MARGVAGPLAKLDAEMLYHAQRGAFMEVYVRLGSQYPFSKGVYGPVTGPLYRRLIHYKDRPSERRHVCYPRRPVQVVTGPIAE